MKYCPDCESEYMEDVEACSDCGGPLLSDSEYRALQEKRQREEETREERAREYTVSVYTAENKFEADQLEAALKTEGIDVLVKLFRDTAFDGIYVSQKGWAMIEVPERDKERAEAIIREVESTFPKGDGTCHACGEAIDDGAFKFCPHCGEPVQTAAD